MITEIAVMCHLELQSPVRQPVKAVEVLKAVLHCLLKNFML
jgi:hypothetical protein